MQRVALFISSLFAPSWVGKPRIARLLVREEEFATKRNLPGRGICREEDFAGKRIARKEPLLAKEDARERKIVRSAHPSLEATCVGLD
jgi:hypothetical protein